MTEPDKATEPQTTAGTDTVVDSPTEWVAQHIKEYVESNGARGHHWQGQQTLLLTTRGRRSGLLRRTALIYGQDGDRYVVVASKGGAAEHPLWYRNLAADPAVTVQIGAETFAATARTATAEEKPALWRMMADRFPPYDEYQRKTDRDIPVVVLEHA
jgi:deazaflavin-dependent oxidoreductase (nitroreductase family)